MYDVSLKYKWDQENMTRFAVEKAEKQGLEKGMAAGKRDAALAMALKMKEAGEPLERIINYTGLSAEDIAET